MPKKPTTPYGRIIFGKDGKVRRHIETLPSTKLGQERMVSEKFADLLRCHCGMSVSSVELLEEANHDARLSIDGKEVVLQVTEVPPRDFELPRGEPIKGDPRAFAFFSAISSEGHSIDVDKLNFSLLRIIARKLEKRYAPERSGPLWLLIFSTSPFITTEYLENGALKIGSPMQTARSYFAERSWRPFDEIWFTNLQTRPVRILPVDA